MLQLPSSRSPTELPPLDPDGGLPSSSLLSMHDASLPNLYGVLPYQSENRFCAAVKDSSSFTSTIVNNAYYFLYPRYKHEVYSCTNNSIQQKLNLKNPTALYV